MLRLKHHNLFAAWKLSTLWRFATALLLAVASPCQGAPPDGAAEQRAKAVAVLSSIRTTEWPSTAFPAADSPIVVCVLGEEGGEMSDALKRAADESSAQGRTVEIRRLPDAKAPQGKQDAPEDGIDELIKQARAAHVLFICGSESGRLSAILQRLGNANVLTVSDMDSFADRGGMLALSVRSGQVVVDTNTRKIQSTQLKVGVQPAAKEADRASAIKAGMVLNFIRYTDWPASAFAGAESPIVICVLGESEMAEVLRRTVVDQRVHGRTIEVKRLPGLGPSTGMPAASDDAINERLKQAKAGHVLFICDSERSNIDTILRHLSKLDVLTVSDMDSFAERGGMLGLTVRRNKIAVDANPQRIQGTELKVSSQLLRLAQTVKPRGQ